MRFSLSLLALPLSLFGQDRVILANGDLFTGQVIALEQGSVTLKSPHGVEPLQIPDENLLELRFGQSSEEEQENAPLPLDSQEVRLGNGDRFPGKVMSFDGQQLVFQTWFAGDLSIARPEIGTLHFGITPQKVIYEGPSDLGNWDLETRRTWELDDGELLAQNRGMIGQDVNLPKNFIFRATTGWEQSPNFRLYLCSGEPVVPAESPGDCYRLTANSREVTLHRCVAETEDQEKQTLELFTAPLRFRGTKRNASEIEIHIDRSSRLISLHMDGVKIKDGYDPGPPPAGSSFAFESISHSQGNLRVGAIKVEEWDTRSRRVSSEPPATTDLDTINVGDGDRFSGRITAYEPTPSKESFSLKTDLSPEPLTIPLQHCTSVYFAQDPEMRSAEGRYQLNLRTGGRLTLSDIALSRKTLSGTHPWLGRLEIDRRVMQSITKSK